MCRLLGILSFLLLVSPTQATDSSSLDDRARLMVLMHSLEKEMSALRPYLVSDREFRNPKAKKPIADALGRLDNALEMQRPERIDKNPSLSLNLSMMSYHFHRVKQVFELGGYDYARRNLNATTAFCVACHTQVPAVAKGSLSAWNVDTHQGGLEDAEFLFITRRFDLALAIYDRLARGFGSNKLKPDQLSELYNRKIAIFARVFRDPKTAIANLKLDLENQKLPIDVQQNLKAWIVSFESWEKESPQMSTMPVQQFLAKVRAERPSKPFRAIAASDPNLVSYLRISGLLYDHLAREAGNAQAQEILYDLALYEKQLAKLYWFSLYQSYLRECVLKFPKKPLTKTCYELYESDITDQFAAELIPVPESIRNNLEALRKNL